MDDAKVIDAVERSRYELIVDGELAGHADYRSDGGALTFVHTEVPPQHAGKGYGAKLAAGAVGDARRRGLRIESTCSFIDRFL